MDMVLISVIMPTYNRGYIIEKAIESVINQTYLNWELIVVDDASADNTEEIVKAIEDSRVIYIKNEKNMGANYSRNLGCDIAKGEYFAFLDSDNYWESNKLERQIEKLIHSDDNVALVFGRMELNNLDTWVIPADDFDIAELDKILCKENVIDNNTVLLKRFVFEQVGGFDEHMPRLQDWELYFRIVVEYQYKAEYMQEVMDYNIVQFDSITRDDQKYIDALLLFLKKHINYLNVNDVVGHLWTFVQKRIKGNDADKLKEIILHNQIIEGMDIIYDLLIKLHTQTEYYEMLLKWKEHMEKNKNRTIFLKYKEMKDAIIAIYGLGRWGELVYDELSAQNIKVLYGIDRNKEYFHGITIVRPDKIPAEIDVIIVSVFRQYEEICSTLSDKFNGEIVSIEELIA